MVLEVFISHSEQDKDLISLVARSIERLDLDVYVEMFEEYYGEDVVELVQEAIEFCECFLVILTEKSVKSQWVNQEIGYACALEKTIIPVRIGNVKVSGMIASLKGIKSKIEDLDDMIGKIKNFLIGRFDVDSFLVECDHCGEEGEWDLPDEEAHFLMRRKGLPTVHECANCEHENLINPVTLLPFDVEAFED